jgi:hypothetical protein
MHQESGERLCPRTGTGSTGLALRAHAHAELRPAVCGWRDAVAPRQFGYLKNDPQRSIHARMEVSIGSLLWTVAVTQSVHEEGEKAVGLS